MSPWHRARYWVAVGCAAAVTATGLVLATRAPSAPTGPAAAVLGYFGDLQRGDAAAALAAGRVPRGSRALLTDRVLASQQRLAPISAPTVRDVRRHGARAVVDVDYTLAFPVGTRAQHAAVAVRRVRGRWVLRRSVLSTRLVVTPAADRASLGGRAVPTGPVLVFPGAVPVGFDTANLATTATVSFPSRAVTRVRPVLSHAGLLAVAAAVHAAERRCLHHPSVGCPLPRGRVVPGTLRGRLRRGAPPVHGRLTAAAAGVVVVSGRFAVRGTWWRLTFRGRRSRARGTTVVPYRAEGYVGRPVELQWRPA